MTEGEDERKPVGYYVGQLVAGVISALVLWGMYSLYPDELWRALVYSAMILLALACFVKALATLLEKPEEEEEDDDRGL